mgnify:CR=1 FL=1
MFVILDCVDEPPLTLSLREQRHIEAVHHVTTIAFELFEQQGYQNTTIAQIAKAAKSSLISMTSSDPLIGLPPPRIFRE